MVLSSDHGTFRSVSVPLCASRWYFSLENSCHDNSISVELIFQVRAKEKKIDPRILYLKFVYGYWMIKKKWIES